MAIIPFIKNGSQSTAPAFSVEISPVIIQPDKPTNYFLLWNVRGGVKAEGEYLSPINVGWKVQITNLKEAPLKISSYQFECKIPTGNWGIIYLTSQALGCIFTSIKQKTL
jgi:hypothetical protein